jgi:hypothetical protein
VTHRAQLANASFYTARIMFRRHKIVFNNNLSNASNALSRILVNCATIARMRASIFTRTKMANAQRASAMEMPHWTITWIIMIGIITTMPSRGNVKPLRVYKRSRGTILWLTLISITVIAFCFHYDIGMCVGCMFNTTGKHCEQCLPGYSGDALKRTCVKIENFINNDQISNILNYNYKILFEPL